MKILKAGTYGFFDVFTGSGWQNHTRVRWNKRVGHLQFVTGKHLSKKQVQEVQSFILKDSPEHLVVPPVVTEKSSVAPHLYLVK